MELIRKILTTKAARISAIALVLSGLITFISSSSADHSGTATYDFNIKVFHSDPALDIPVAGAQIRLVADDGGHPDNGATTTTDAGGNAHFRVHSGSFNVEFRHQDYYNRDYWMPILGNTFLDATLLPLVTTPTPTPTPTPGPTPTPTPTPGGCLPTPPRGQPLLNIWPISESGADCTDYPLLRAKNLTRGSGYTRDVASVSGDVIRVRLYVHNGNLDFPENVARNVMIAPNIPSSRGFATLAASA